MKLVISVLVLMSAFINVQGQLTFQTLNSNQNIEFEAKLFEQNYFHQIFRPINLNKIDSTVHYPHSDRKYWLMRKLKEEDFSKIRQKNYYLSVNPLINYQKTKVADSAVNWYQNTRGIEIKARIGEKLSFNSIFYENQASFPGYIDDYVQQHIVVPGHGATKIFKETQHDYSQALANFSFQATENFNVSFGHGKQFIGSGYRSFLLSDFSFSYPYFKLQYENKRWQYTALWTEYNNFYYKYYAIHYRKNASYQTLSYSPIPSFTALFFQSVLWKTQIAESGRTYPWQLFVPIPFIQPSTYGLDNENNVQLGLNLEYRLINYVKIYSQFLLDDLKTEKYAWQMGLFVPRINGKLFPKAQFSIRAELNYASSNVFDLNDSIQTYTHYNESLAHPLGNNFTEKLVQIQFDIFDFKLIAFYNQYQQIGNAVDLLYTNKQFEHSKQDVENLRLELAYIFNKQTYLQIFAGYYQHKTNALITSEYFSLGIRTYLHNEYFDF